MSPVWRKTHGDRLGPWSNLPRLRSIALSPAVANTRHRRSASGYTGPSPDLCSVNVDASAPVAPGRLPVPVRHIPKAPVSADTYIVERAAGASMRARIHPAQPLAPARGAGQNPGVPGTMTTHHHHHHHTHTHTHHATAEHDAAVRAQSRRHKGRKPRAESGAQCPKPGFLQCPTSLWWCMCLSACVCLGPDEGRGTVGLRPMAVLACQSAAACDEAATVRCDKGQRSPDQ
jgi:hypothetical protein